MDKLTIKTENIILKLNTGSIVVFGGNVQSVNGKTGAVTLDANDVDAATEQYVDEKIAELPTAPVLSVNGEIGEVRLDAIKVNAEPLGAVQQAKDEIQPQIESLSENKLDKVDYVQHFLGVFPSKAALDAAHPTARPGDSADIDSGSGFDVMRAIWDDSDHKWVVREVGNTSNTDQVPEGSTNLYFKAERVLSTLLAGFNPVNTAISAADTVVQGLSKAQGQISNIINTFAANVRATQLNGLNTTNTNDVGTGDTVLIGIGKLQAKFGVFDNLVRAATLFYVDTTPTTTPIGGNDTVLTGFGKLQGQITSDKTWFSVKSFTGIQWHSSIDVANSTIEVAKIGGNLWVRGWLRCTASMPANIPLVFWTQAFWQMNVAGLGYPTNYYHIGSIVNTMHSNSDTTYYRLSLRQQSGLINNGTYLVLDQTAAAVGVMPIAAFCVGKAL